jgi:Ca-activated chloride channel homolog
LLLFALVAVLPRSSLADPADKTLSPYFVVEGASPGVEALPLQSTNADVRITGVIADVVVTQTYRNDGDRTINARYVFPASTRAAVYGMQMKIGDRVIVARIKERQEARVEYEAAKAAGKTATLLEQDRPNVFSMNVSNILPNDRIDVELRYTELLVPTDGVYELVYPTVVGPRYASETARAGDPRSTFVASPYTRAGVDPQHAFDIKVSLAAGMKIHGIESPSHAIASKLAAASTTASIALAPGSSATGNRDFVLRYRLAGDELASGLVLYPGSKESFFLMMVQPPRRPAIEQILPREYVFIIDVSGSMHGFPLHTTKMLMRDLLGRLRESDRFNVLLFSGGSALFSEQSVQATPAQVSDAIAFIGRQTGGGGTELLPALQRAMKLPRAGMDISRSFVVVTDGYIAEETAMFEHVRRHLGQANVFSFGIGSGVNRHLTDGLAKAGQGEPFTVLDASQATEAARKFREYVESPVLTRVEVKFDGFDAYDVEPKVLPDVFANRPVVVFGKYKGAPGGKVTLTGISGRGRFVSTIDASTVTPDSRSSALAYLWARAKISELSDFFQGDANKDAVTRLGLEYNLLTRYTSFIAVHQVVRATGPATDVAHPQPMPAGVSDLAISGPDYSSMEVGPEPELPILVGFIGVGLVLWRRRSQRGAQAAAPRSAA